MLAVGLRRDGTAEDAGSDSFHCLAGPPPPRVSSLALDLKFHFLLYPGPVADWVQTLRRGRGVGLK